MSLHYLLDGYNIIHQIPKLLEYKLENQREGFIRLIQTQNFVGSVRNQITVVFDGQADIYGHKKYDGLGVVFSQNESADDKIKALVKSCANRKNVRVVTDDRALQYSVRALGAKTVCVKDFLSPSSAQIRENKPGKKSIHEEVKLQINAELEDIWLKDKR